MDELNYQLPCGKCYKVLETIEHAHPRSEYHDYPLLRGDLLMWGPIDGWMKFAPGLAIHGFELTPEQITTLRIIDTPHILIGGMSALLKE